MTLGRAAQGILRPSATRQNLHGVRTIVAVEMNGWTIGLRVTVCDDSKLNVKLKRATAGERIALHPATVDEPLFRTYRANRLRVKHGDIRHEAGTGDIVVTATRVLLLLRRGQNGKGAERFGVISIPRGELSVPSTQTDRHGSIKSIELTSTDGATSVSAVPSLNKSFANLVDTLAPKSAQQLGPEAAAVRREAKQSEARLKEAQAVEADKVAELSAGG